MAGSSILRETFLVPRDIFPKASLWAALDAGSTLLKVIYVAKEDATNKNDIITVHGRIYHLKDHMMALQELKDRCYVPAGSELRVTGVWIKSWRLKIESFLHVKVCFVDELIAQTVGMHFLLEKVEGNFCVSDLGPNPNFDPPDVPMILERRPLLLERMTANNHTKTGSICPANFLIIGSTAIFTHMDSNSHVSVRQFSMFGGLSFLALAKLLLGTDDYDVIMDLASRGNQNKSETDVSIGDWAPGGDVNAHCPLSLFTFGKMVTSSIECPSCEDIAASLVAFLAEIVFTLALDVAERTGINRFYVSGNWTRALVARQALCKQWSLLHPSAIEFKFLKTGLATALGSVLLESKATNQQC